MSDNDLDFLYSWAKNNNYKLTITLHNNKITLTANRKLPAHKKKDYDAWENRRDLIRRFTGKHTTIYVQ